MLDKIVKKNDSEYVIIFDNKPAVTITSDCNNALHLVESLLSPRYDMGYSQYLAVVANSKEDTNPCYILGAA